MRSKNKIVETDYPKLIKEWDPALNKELKLTDFSKGSNNIGNWKCSINQEHIWPAMISNRANKGQGCPFCLGRKVLPKDSFGMKEPDLMKEWSWSLNKNIDPFTLTRRSGQNVWWECSNEITHIWEASPHRRTGTCPKCPYCLFHILCPTNNLKYLYPDLALRWDYNKNGNVLPSQVLPNSTTKYWWICDYNHSFPRDPKHIAIRGQRECSFCRGHNVCESNCLATTYPHLLKEWHPTLNGDITPYNIVASANKRVWWICEKDPRHIWDNKPGIRTILSRGCPYCAGIKVLPEESFGKLYPDLLKEWVYDKNKINPFNVSPGSSSNIWWSCHNSIEHNAYQCEIRGRVNGYGCKECGKSSGHKLTKKYLDKYNQIYLEEQSFEGCRDKYPLRFDFYLPQNNVIIEYDGQQHYEPIDYFGGEDYLITVQRRDQIKNKYCADNNIKLVRIPYTEKDNIENILIRELDLTTEVLLDETDP